MAEPTKYERSYGFADYQANNPSRPLPGPEVDRELDDIANSLDETIDALADIRRADGALQNGIVTRDSLAPGVFGMGEGDRATEAADRAEDAADRSEAAADRAEAVADMVAFTRARFVFDGDGTATPITLPITVDDTKQVTVVVGKMEMTNGIDYTVSGDRVTPLGPDDGGAMDVWPKGTKNIVVQVDRALDLAVITTDDVTHDGELLSGVLDDLVRRSDMPNVFRIEDYLHKDDLAAAQAGDNASQNGSRVTAAIRQCLEDGVAALFAADGASVVVSFPPGVYRINDRLMSDAFHNILWNGGNTRSRLTFDTSGSVTFRIQGWVPGRASMRTDGIYAGSTHIAPHAVFEWFQRSGFQNFSGMNGKWFIEGANNTGADPIGWYFYRLNATQIGGEIECRNLRNRNFVFDSIFNSKVDYARSATGGLMLTECGSTGLLPNDTVAGTVRTGLRYTVSGTTLTINTMVYDSDGPSYAYTPYSVFTADHVGKWIALDRQGVDNLLGDDIDDSNEGGVARRSARWFQIASVTDGSTVELTEAPPYQTSTGQWVPHARTFSFEVLKVSVTAGSTAATLSMPVSQSLVGLEVVIPGAGYDGGPSRLPDLVAMVTAHSNTSITLSHAALISKSDVPFVTAPQVSLSSLSHTALLGTSRKCDDMHFGRLWCESGTAPALPLHIHSTTNVTLGDESKLHGSSLNTPNFGANFACVMGGDIGARLAGRFTHSRHSPRFGMFYITGDRAEIKLDGELSSWTADSGSAIWYLDPANVATTRIWDIYYNASDYAYGFPQVAGGQVFERGGVNWTPGRIKAGASQRSPRGERPSWPQAALPAVRAPAVGSLYSDAVSAVARGWVPDDGVVYQIGGRGFLGDSTSTDIVGLPGMRTWGHGYVSAGSAITIEERHNGQYISLPAGATVTLPSGLYPGFSVTLASPVSATSVCTLVPGGSDTVRRDAFVWPGEVVMLVYDGSGWHRNILNGFWNYSAVNAPFLIDLSATATPSGCWRATPSTVQSDKPAHFSGNNLAVEVFQRTSTHVVQRVYQLPTSLGAFERNSTGVNTWTLWRNGGDMPSLSTSQRNSLASVTPGPSNCAIGTTVFANDITTPRLLTWNGANWIDGAGTIV